MGFNVTLVNKQTGKILEGDFVDIVESFPATEKYTDYQPFIDKEPIDDAEWMKLVADKERFKGPIIPLNRSIMARDRDVMIQGLRPISDESAPEEIIPEEKKIESDEEAFSVVRDPDNLPQDTLPPWNLNETHSAIRVGAVVGGGYHGAKNNLGGTYGFDLALVQRWGTDVNRSSQEEFAE